MLSLYEFDEDINLLSFPQKLFYILEKESESVISWLSHGIAFQINDYKKFGRVIIPKYFKQSKFSSFQRQLNLYGFRKVLRGDDAGAYFHPFFQRNRKDLVAEISRSKDQQQLPSYEEVMALIKQPKTLYVASLMESNLQQQQELKQELGTTAGKPPSPHTAALPSPNTLMRMTRGANARDQLLQQQQLQLQQQFALNQPYLRAPLQSTFQQNSTIRYEQGDRLSSQFIPPAMTTVPRAPVLPQPSHPQNPPSIFLSSSSRSSSSSLASNPDSQPNPYLQKHQLLMQNSILPIVRNPVIPQTVAVPASNKIIVPQSRLVLNSMVEAPPPCLPLSQRQISTTSTSNTTTSSSCSNLSQFNLKNLNIPPYNHYPDTTFLFNPTPVSSATASSVSSNPRKRKLNEESPSGSPLSSSPSSNNTHHHSYNVNSDNGSHFNDNYCHHSERPSSHHSSPVLPPVSDKTMIDKVDKLGKQPRLEVPSFSMPIGFASNPHSFSLPYDNSTGYMSAFGSGGGEEFDLRDITIDTPIIEGAGVLGGNYPHLLDLDGISEFEFA